MFYDDVIKELSVIFSKFYISSNIFKIFMQAENMKTLLSHPVWDIVKSSKVWEIVQEKNEKLKMCPILQ